MTYEIEVKEELSRIVKVRADSLAEAVKKVEDKYKSCVIVLDEDDFKRVRIKPYKDIKIPKLK